MANTSITIVVSTPLTVAQSARYVSTAGDPRNGMRSLENLFEKLKCGIEKASVTVQTSGSPPVAAAQTLTLTYASIANNDTCVVAGVTLTCVTGTPAGPQFKKQTDATVTAANLAALINSLATVNIYVRATSALGVVTITANQVGKVGNFITLVGSTGIVAGAATFAGGTGGAETAAITFNRG